MGFYRPRYPACTPSPPVRNGMGLAPTQCVKTQQQTAACSQMARPKTGLEFGDTGFQDSGAGTEVEETASEILRKVISLNLLRKFWVNLLSKLRTKIIFAPKAHLHPNWSGEGTNFRKNRAAYETCEFLWPPLPRVHPANHREKRHGACPDPLRRNAVKNGCAHDRGAPQNWTGI